MQYRKMGASIIYKEFLFLNLDTFLKSSDFIGYKYIYICIYSATFLSQTPNKPESCKNQT
jgi:hypothetical protein